MVPDIVCRIGIIVTLSLCARTSPTVMAKAKMVPTTRYAFLISLGSPFPSDEDRFPPGSQAANGGTAASAAV
jgi:hypothetical protein